MWLLMWVSISFAHGVEIAVSGPGEVLVKAADEPVHVASCRGVVWDLFDPRTKVFEPASAPACEGMKSAIRIDEAGISFQIDAILPPLPSVGFHVVRPVVIYGGKCREKAVFSLAGCASIKTIKGPQMVVRSRGLAVPIVQSAL